MSDNFDVISFRAPSTYPGDLTRPNAPFTAEPGIGLASNPPTQFGNPVALDASTGHYRPIGAGDTAANIAGAVLRSFPTQSATYPNPTTFGGTGVNAGALNILKDGYIAVNVYGSAAPVKGGAVYVGTVANAGHSAVGAISAASDTTNSFVWLGAQFTGGIDANGNSEIHFRVQ